MTNTTSKSTSTKTIKEILIEANQYQAVLELLQSILFDKQQTYPVDLYIDREEVKNRVQGKQVRDGAKQLFEVIKSDATIRNTEIAMNSLNPIMQYTKSHSDTMLHNYAIQVSHRLPTEVNMEETRTWLVLHSLILNIEISNAGCRENWEIVKNKRSNILTFWFKLIKIKDEKSATDRRLAAKYCL